MDLIVNTLVQFLTYVTNLGNVLMMPLVLTLLSLAFGMKLIDAIRNSVKVGIGFMGFALVSSMVVSIVGPGVNLMVERHDLGRAGARKSVAHCHDRRRYSPHFGSARPRF